MLLAPSLSHATINLTKTPGVVKGEKIEKSHEIIFLEIITVFYRFL